MIRFGYLKPKVFVAQLAQAFALLALDFVVPEVGECQILHADAVIGPFQVGDYLCCHALDPLSEPLTAMKAWFKIAGIIEEHSVDHPHGVWSLEHVQDGKVGAAIGAGNVIVNFGRTTASLSNQMEDS